MISGDKANTTVTSTSRLAFASSETTAESTSCAPSTVSVAAPTGKPTGGVAQRTPEAESSRFSGLESENCLEDNLRFSQNLQALELNLAALESGSATPVQVYIHKKTN